MPWNTPQVVSANQAMTDVNVSGHAISVQIRANVPMRTFSATITYRTGDRVEVKEYLETTQVVGPNAGSNIQILKVRILNQSTAVTLSLYKLDQPTTHAATPAANGGISQYAPAQAHTYGQLPGPARNQMGQLPGAGYDVVQFPQQPAAASVYQVVGDPLQNPPDRYAGINEPL